MEKMVLVATFFLASIFSFNIFAEKDDAKEVTIRELIAEGTSMGIQAALMYAYFACGVHNHIKPSDDKSPAGQTFDILFKGYLGAFLGNKAKSFFEKLQTLLKQPLKPLTDPIFGAIKGA